jgi:hypothetical protein
MIDIFAAKSHGLAIEAMTLKLSGKTARLEGRFHPISK